MFNNNTRLFYATGSGLLSTLIDGPTNGRTVRSFAGISSGTTNSLTITHGESSENGSIPTQRSNVRVGISKEIEDSGKFAIGYAQLTIVTPTGVVTETEVRRLIAALVNFLTLTDITSEMDGDSHGVQADDLAAVPRLLAREP
jgi:hypothetical protein